MGERGDMGGAGRGTKGFKLCVCPGRQAADIDI